MLKGRVSVMGAIVRHIRLGLALAQVAGFTLGLTIGDHVTINATMQTRSQLTASHGSGADLAAVRRPPRWPGRSKNAKGLAVREASATRPLAIVV